MDREQLKRNIDAVYGFLARFDGVTLVAATKTVPPDVINDAIDLGITDVGENRVGEFVEKKPFVKNVTHHFIGALQSNKAKFVVGEVSLIQSADRRSLVDEISRLATKKGIVQDVLIEVNAANEPGKSGVAADDAEELAAYCDEKEGVRVRGLMSVPPIGADEKIYKMLYALYERIKTGRDAFDILSVGMSADYETAVENGSNMVRIGTAIFGKRLKI